MRKLRSISRNLAAGALAGVLCLGLLAGCHHPAASAATPGAPGGPGVGPQNSALTNPNAVENQGGVDKQFMPGGGPPGGGK